MKKFMSRGWFTCVFVCLSCFLISEKLSAEVNGGDEVRTVTLNMWNVSLKEILTEIEKQAGVTFSYESSLLKEFQKTMLHWTIVWHDFLPAIRSCTRGQEILSF